MSPTLTPAIELIVDGRPGRLFGFAGDAVKVGRDPTSDVPLDDTKVSWSHARFERKGPDQFRVIDLNSTNKTYLDGIALAPQQAATLRDGARVRIARRYELVFRLPAVRISDDPLAESTVMGEVGDLSSAALASRSARPALALQALLDVSRSLGGAADLNEVLGRALDGLLGAFERADCGFILTAEPDGRPMARAVRHRRGSDRPLAISRTIVDKVLGEGRAILISDARLDARFQEAGSLLDSGVRTAVIVPLAGHDGNPIGIVQLDSRDAAAGFTAEDLELLAALAVPVGVAVENHRLLKRQAAWAAAREIQDSLLPRGRPKVPGYAFWECYRPALEVGGDLYDYIPVGPAEPGSGPSGTRWVITVGDVAGKGMPAALMMAGFCPEVRHLARGGLDSLEVLARVNRHVLAAAIDGRFVTLALVELDAQAHRLKVVNAGHTDILLRRASGEVVAVGTEGAGPPLGVDPRAEFATSTISLEPGDVVVLYSDGVTEAMDCQGRLLGTERLIEVIAAAAGEPRLVGEAIASAVKGHSVGRSQFDDVTVVCFGRT